MTTGRPIRTLLVAIAVIAATALSGLATAGSANASVKTTIDFAAVHASVVSGGRGAYTYNVHHLVRGGKIWLVKKSGSGIYGIQTLSRHSGTVSVGKLYTGKYTYRVQASKPIGHGRYKFYAYSRFRNIYSYGHVSYANLCNDYVQSSYNDCGFEPSAQQVGANLFAFAAELGVESDPARVFQFPRTSCRSLSMTFGIPNSELEDGLVETLSVVQTRYNPVSVDVGGNQLATLTARLDGGPWTMTAEDNVHIHDMLINGYAVCYTRTGLR